MDPRTGVDILTDFKIHCTYRESSPFNPAHTVVTIPTELTELPVESDSSWNLNTMLHSELKFCFLS